MFCRARGMQPQHTNQPVFETDGAMLYKKRAKRARAMIFFKKMKFTEGGEMLGVITNENVNLWLSADNQMAEHQNVFCKRC